MIAVTLQFVYIDRIVFVYMSENDDVSGGCIDGHFQNRNVFVRVCEDSDNVGDSHGDCGGMHLNPVVGSVELKSC